MSGNG
jgi:hypothetical protein